jgi:hypothetical protein
LFLISLWFKYHKPSPNQLILEAEDKLKRKMPLSLLIVLPYFDVFQESKEVTNIDIAAWVDSDKEATGIEGSFIFR